MQKLENINIFFVEKMPYLELWMQIWIFSVDIYQTFTRKYIHFAYMILAWLLSTQCVIMGHVGDMAFLHMQKTHITSHVCDMAFLPGQKTSITTFRALWGLAFDSAYDIK